MWREDGDELAAGVEELKAAFDEDDVVAVVFGDAGLVCFRSGVFLWDRRVAGEAEGKWGCGCGVMGGR